MTHQKKKNQIYPSDPRMAEEAETLLGKSLDSAGIEEKQAKMNLGSYDPERFPDAKMALEAVHAYMESPGGIILLYGPTGVGKTHLATGMMVSWLMGWIQKVSEGVSEPYQMREYWWHGKFIQVPALKMRMKRLMGSFAGQAEIAKITEEAMNAPTLVLDDLGREEKMKSLTEAIDQIAEKRDRTKQPTIITTNKSSAFLRSRYGDPVASRLFLPATIIKINGPDQRRQIT